MTIIHRYILRHFVPVFLLALTAFVGLYMIIDFFEKVDDMLEQNVPLILCAAYFTYKIPFILTQGIPMSALLGALVGLGLMKRNRELIALETAGSRPSYYVAPIVCASLILALIHFLVGETLSRTLNQEAEKISKEQFYNIKTPVTYGYENLWVHGHSVIYQILLYDVQKHSMEKVSLFYLDDRFRLAQRLDAQKVRWEGDRWVAENGLLLRFKGSEMEQEWFERRDLDLAETPNDFGSVETIPQELGWLSLYRYARKIRQEGYQSTPYEVELHLRVALPFTTIILTLLGLTIALRQDIHSGIPLSIGVALGTTSLYLGFFHVGSGLASASILSPLLGVWAGNIIFICLTLYLWMTHMGRR